MAQSYNTDSGTLIIPQAVASTKVETANSGLATTGVLLLVGEADGGPRFDLEDSLQDNAYGPDQLAAVTSKYQAGPLVDAFRLASTPSNDPNIVGAPSRIILVKTNSSGKANAALMRQDGDFYMSGSGRPLSLADKGYGKGGNRTYFTITERTPETLPTTGAFTWLLPRADIDAAVSVNGAAPAEVTIAAGTTPAGLASAFSGADIDVDGGEARTVISTVTGTLALTATGSQVVITRSVAWQAALPQVGSTLFIPATSVISGGAGQNAGSYVVTASTTTTISATKLLNDTGTGGVTAPVTVAATNIVAVGDVQIWTPVTFTVTDGDPIPGISKSMEIADRLSGAETLESCAKALGATTVDWVSRTSHPRVLFSATEQRLRLTVTRQVDNIQEELDAGGEVAVKIGYFGNPATVTITDTTLTTTVTGGPGNALSLELRDFPTLQDLVTFVNAQSGYKAALVTANLGQLPSTALDRVVAAGIVRLYADYGCGLKIDGYRFSAKTQAESALVQLQDDLGAVTGSTLGLPTLYPDITYLTGGSKGSTSDADVTAALLALEKVRGNFVVPLFSRDASLDIVDRLTESMSTYTIESVNAATRSHVLKMSTLKRRKNRQAVLSFKSTFANARTAAANTASFRCAMPFMDVRTSGADGTVKQFAPWMGAVNAAAMQLAGFYKAIVRKFANINGALQAAKDFDDQDDTQVEDALLSGLLPMRRAETGGWYWVSDQTTYGRDANFVFNSIQATYAADVIAMTTAERMETAFVGQSQADVNAALALAYLEAIMEDFLRLKLIAPSDDAPRGFRNASIKINGPAMIVSLEVKLAGTIYFIPISFLVSQVQQSA